MKNPVIKSGFNFQVHTNKRTSVFRFSTAGMKLGTWQQYTALASSFTKPPWADEVADWAEIDRIQVTAFGNGPYNG